MATSHAGNCGNGRRATSHVRRAGAPHPAGLASIAALASAGTVGSAGLQTGECVRRGHQIEGVAVELARSIARKASPGELLVSRTVKDLVAGAGLHFVERGRHAMPHGAGEWRLYAVRGVAA